MGFDQDTVQRALAQAGGNEQLAINLILNGEVRDAATASSSAASFAASAVSFSGPSFGFGTAFAPAEVASSSSEESSSSSMSTNVLLFTDRLTHRPVSLALVADGNLPPPMHLRVQIMRPFELIKAAAWFFARQLPGMKRHREEPPPPTFPRACQCASCWVLWRLRAIDWPPRLPICACSTR
jgi:UBA/TS-N domain